MNEDKPLEFKDLEYYDRRIKEHIARVLDENCLIKAGVESDYDSIIDRRATIDDGLIHIPDINIIYALIDRIDALEARIDALESASRIYS